MIIVLLITILALIKPLSAGQCKEGRQKLNEACGDGNGKCCKSLDLICGVDKTCCGKVGRVCGGGTQTPDGSICCSGECTQRDDGKFTCTAANDNSDPAMENNEIEDDGSLNAKNTKNTSVEFNNSELILIIGGIIGIICIMVGVGLFFYVRYKNSKLKQMVSQSELSDEEQSEIEIENEDLKEGQNIST